MGKAIFAQERETGPSRQGFPEGARMLSGNPTDQSSISQKGRLPPFAQILRSGYIILYDGWNSIGHAETSKMQAKTQEFPKTDSTLSGKKRS